MERPWFKTVADNKHVRLLLLCITHFLYLAVGAVVFGAIEGPSEAVTAIALRKLRADFMNRSANCISDAELEDFIEQVINANNRGVSAEKNVTVDPSWNFGASLFFASSVLTTIGYGHVAPLSESGKLFCIFYALLGLPLTIVLMTAIVQRLMIPTRAMLHRFENVRIIVSRDGRLLVVRLLHLFVVCAVVFVLACLIPSAILVTTERGWLYADALYFCFITLMTIGLGDYVPGDQPDQQDRGLYKVAAAMYLFFGLALMMLVLATIRNIRELDVGRYFYVRTRYREGERQRLVGSQHPSHHHEQHDAASGGISIILNTPVTMPTGDLGGSDDAFELGDNMTGSTSAPHVEH